MTYLTVDEAAAELRVSVKTLRIWINSGSLQAFNLNGRSTRIKRSDLDEFVNRGRVIPA